MSMSTNPPDLVRMQQWLMGLQDAICADIEQLDGAARFHEDTWQRAEGGGGRTRILRDGAVFEQAGIGFSRVEGTQMPPSATAHRPELAGQPWTAMGVSLVFHPRNPHIPTTHMNVRLFATRGDHPAWWFGGGFDLTPFYPNDADIRHWHQTAHDAVAPFGDGLYAEFKAWCDRYFFLKHRNEPRGVGGIFFDDFNLVFDRGTLFGLQSGGRTESILMSLPPLVRWEYGYAPEPDSAETRLADYLRPRDWLKELPQ